VTVPSHERWRSFIYSLGVSILPLRTTVCFIGFWNCSGSVIFFVFILYFHFLMPFTFRIRYYNESLWEETFDIAMRVYERKHSILQWEFMRGNIQYCNESLWEETFDITMRVYERKHSILQWEFMRGNIRYYNESLWDETFDITMRVYERKHSILQWEFMRGNIRYYNESLWEEMLLLSCICITTNTEKRNDELA
jgi:hypothetical protein